jgi:predicted dehydrogenase
MIMPARINVAVIGIGGYGHKLLKAIQHVPSLRIYQCYHPDERKAREASHAFGCIPAFHEEEVFEDENVHAVVIAAPDQHHFSFIEKALAADKHIYVEKPMVGRWHELIALEKRIGIFKRIMFVGHNMRRESAFRWIKQEYLKGALGRLVSFHISLSHGGAYNWTDNYWRSKPDDCREGPIRVNGVHASDVLEYLFGPVESVYAKIFNLAAKQLTPDSGIALAKVADTFGTIETQWIVPSINRFHFRFTESLVDYDLAKLMVRNGRDIDCVATPFHEVVLPPVDVRLEQMKEFAGAILGKNEVETGWHQGMRAVRFFEACWRSQNENKEIWLSEL